MESARSVTIYDMVCRYKSHRINLCELIETVPDEEDEKVSTLSLCQRIKDVSSNEF